MENKRATLADKMEIIGRIFEIDGMGSLLSKYERDMNNVKFSAVTIQVSGLLLRKDKKLADQVISMSRGISLEDVQKLEDGEYATALRDAFITDVMGFFGSSQHSDGKQ